MTYNYIKNLENFASMMSKYAQSNNATCYLELADNTAEITVNLKCLDEEGTRHYLRVQATLDGVHFIIGILNTKTAPTNMKPSLVKEKSIMLEDVFSFELMYMLFDNYINTALKKLNLTLIGDSTHIRLAKLEPVFVQMLQFFDTNETEKLVIQITGAYEHRTVSMHTSDMKMILDIDWLNHNQTPERDTYYELKATFFNAEADEAEYKTSGARAFHNSLLNLLGEITKNPPFPSL